jgi:hypothetical protein
MNKPMNPKAAEEKAKKKLGNLQHQNPPQKTDTNNRNPPVDAVAVSKLLFVRCPIPAASEPLA